MTSASERPLFIALAARWYDLFVAGRKTVEYRRAAGPWNEKTCRVGRPVVLSRGYGKAARLKATIVAFKTLPRSRAPKAAREIYPDAEKFAAISLRISP